MKKIMKLKNQIKILNQKLSSGNVKNPFALEVKIRKLKMELYIETENYNWEAFESI